MKYKSLTDYCGKLDNPGEWVDSKIFKDKYYTMPYVGYSKDVIKFIDCVYDTVESIPEMARYSDILEKSNIKWNSESMRNVDTSKLDILTILALLIGIVRADRFCEGVLLDFIKDKTIEKWLERLKELDK